VHQVEASRMGEFESVTVPISSRHVVNCAALRGNEHVRKMPAQHLVYSSPHMCCPEISQLMLRADGAGKYYATTTTTAPCATEDTATLSRITPGSDFLVVSKGSEEELEGVPEKLSATEVVLITLPTLADSRI
jgi:hypothetical protein